VVYKWPPEVLADALFIFREEKIAPMLQELVHIHLAIAVAINGEEGHNGIFILEAQALEEEFELVDGNHAGSVLVQRLEEKWQERMSFLQS